MKDENSMLEELKGLLVFFSPSVTWPLFIANISLRCFFFFLFSSFFFCFLTFYFLPLFSGSCFTFRFWFVLYYGIHSSILPLPCFATLLTSRVVKTDTACSAWLSTTWPWSCGQRSSSAWAGWCARSQQAVSFTSNVVVPMATSLREGRNKRKGSSKPVMGFRMSQKGRLNSIWSQKPVHKHQQTLIIFFYLFFSSHIFRRKF